MLRQPRKPIRGNIISNKLLDDFPDGIIMQNKSGTISYVNSKICSMLGYKPSELIGVKHKEAVKILVGSETYYTELRYNFKEVLKGKSFTVKRNLKTKEGFNIPVRQYLNPVANNEGKITGSIFIFKDLYNELLFEISHTINSSLDINKIIETTSNIIFEHLGLSSISIFLYDDQKQELQMAACNIIKKEDMKNFTCKLGQGATGLIAAERRPLYIRDMKTDPLITAQTKKFISAKSSIGFPLISKDEILGVILFNSYNIRNFSTQEIFIFESIANQLSMAIYNAKLFNITKKLSITDGLTGLYNYHYFQECLDEQIINSKKYFKPLSLLMMDLDNFKEINDKFGHPMGDQVLIKVATILNHCLRSDDIICRYGGEEFAIILTDCTNDSAYALSERVRIAIENLNISAKEVYKLTTSIGVATFPEHATNKNDLVDLADTTLYKAKKTKNIVCLAQFTK